MSGDIQAITMPKWGLAMEEGIVVAWHVEPGREVGPGDDLLDIETPLIDTVRALTIHRARLAGCHP